MGHWITDGIPWVTCLWLWVIKQQQTSVSNATPQVRLRTIKHNPKYNFKLCWMLLKSQVSKVINYFRKMFTRLLHTCLAFGNRKVFVHFFNIILPLAVRGLPYIQHVRCNVLGLVCRYLPQMRFCWFVYSSTVLTTLSQTPPPMHTCVGIRDAHRAYTIPLSRLIQLQHSTEEKKTQNRTTTKHHCCLCCFIIGFRSLSKTMSRLSKTITMRSLMLLKPLRCGLSGLALEWPSTG